MNPITLTALRAALAALVLAAAGGVAAQSSAVSAERGWTRPTVAGQPAAGGYLVLQNKGGADRVVAASSPVAQRVELHTMTLDNDIMRMRQLDAIDLPAGQTVELRPGGLHLMVFGLKAPLKTGERLPLVLTLEKGGELRTELAVRPTPPGGPAPAEHGTHGAHGGAHKH
ncbi:copper chaperone PCu(A)C [Aquabacterium sp. J223]|uniref:copper chaperone PCu(A)C n=1 Tax=Aquabacterium sp. J223 TaxID=2898431 RepID=UPI0021ADFBBF|nr:copper chaperone PCu(A)C [Aquabacterium sp. J223]UUX95990.1 copper chaperone PCu(A)C [Aquabacterium sp. J223]